MVFFHYFRDFITFQMKNRLIILITLLIAGCQAEKNAIYLTPEKALDYFQEIKEVCDKDNGKLWGINLYAPLMFVDRNTRRIVANMSDDEGLLKEREGVFTATEVPCLPWCPCPPRRTITG